MEKETKLKILYIASEPAVGMVPFAAAIINAMHEAGHEVYAITVSQKDSPYANVIDKGVHHIALQFPQDKWGKLAHKFWPYKIYNLINKTAQENGINNIHFLTGEYGFALWHTQKLNKRYNLIYTVHDLEQHPSKGRPLKTRFLNKYFHWATIRNIKKTRKLATCNLSQVKKLKEAFPQKTIYFHPFPSLVTKEMKKGHETCSELKGENGYILFFGTFGFYKGVHLLYNAFLDSPLANKTKLVFAGKGADFFEHRSDEKNIIRINRFINDAEIAEMYKNAKIVVYPYIQATMSGVLSIAHYFCKPVLASDVTFFKDNINSNDTLFKAGNEKDLRTKLCQLYDASNNIQDMPKDTTTDFVNQLSNIYSPC